MTYATVQGDMWDSIAYRLLGSTRYTDALMNANITHIETFIFDAGVVLNVPEINDAGDVPSTLPPWKKV